MLTLEENAPFSLSVMQDGRQIGVIRWKLLWDEIPFLELIRLEEGERKKGFGTRALALFECLLKERKFRSVLVSTREDETGQDFFRKLGYRDCGGIDMSGFTAQKAKELFLYKNF